jgi:hypothetical protein
MKLNVLMPSLLIALVGIGCSTPKRTDLVSTGRVKVEKSDTPELMLIGPHVTQSEGIVEFKGEVHRKPSFDGTPQGHIHLDLFDAKGEWIDQVAVGWQPHDIPTTGDRSATYVLQYYWSPPPGAIVRASIVDDEHLAGTSSGGSSAAGGRSTNPGYGNATPQPGGSPRNNATRTPGTPRQPSQPHTPGISSGGGGGSGGRR